MDHKNFNTYLDAAEYAKKMAKTHGVSVSVCREGDAFLVILPASLNDTPNRLGAIENAVKKVQKPKLVQKKKGIKRRFITYVATANSKERIFHNSKCLMMKNVSLENEITFSNREAAIRRGYSPCKLCRA